VGQRGCQSIALYVADPLVVGFRGKRSDREPYGESGNFLQVGERDDPMALAQRIKRGAKNLESSMVHLVGYAGILVLFGAIDALWLSLMGPVLYRSTLGDILLAQVRLGPAIVFYVVYPVGLLVLALTPALKSNSITVAIGYGFLLGAISYATYDLTNFATLRNWTLQLTLVDIAYGAVVSGLAAAAGFVAARAVA
jgi:uncharacterized membrane protein